MPTVALTRQIKGIKAYSDSSQWILNSFVFYVLNVSIADVEGKHLDFVLVDVNLTLLTLFCALFALFLTQ